MRTELVRDDRLNKDLAFAALDVSGDADLRGLWTLSVDGIRGGNPYGFGIDAESRVFFNPAPLMPLPAVGAFADCRPAGGLAKLSPVSGTSTT